MAKKLAIRILFVLLAVSVLVGLLLTAVSCFRQATSMDISETVWRYATLYFLRVLFWMALFSLVCASISYAVAVRVLSPLHLLVDDVKDMASGNMEVHSKYYARQDEVGMLARAFNGMRTTLKITLDYLERQVEERTASINMIIDSSPCGLALIDRERKVIVRVNRQLCSMLGCQNDVLVGASCEEMLCNGRECVARQSADEEVFTRECFVKRSDGQELVLLERAVPVMLDGTLYHLAMFVDITEQRNAMRAVADSERQYRDLIQNVSAGIIVFNCDRSVLMINRVSLNLLGMSEEQIVGRRVSDLDWGELVLEDGTVLEDQSRLLNAVFENEQELKGRIVGIRAKHAEQTAWMLLNVHILRNEQNRMERVLLIASDVTEMKQMRDEYRELFETGRKLQDEVARAHSVIKNLPDPTMFVDPQGCLTYGNKAFCDFFDVEPAAVHGALLTTFIDKAEMAELMLEGVRAGINCSGETILTDNEGQEHPVYIQMIVLRTEDDTAPDVAIIISDLTEQREAERRQKQMENRYFQAQKLESIGQLAAGIAHEINTPSQFVGDNLRFLKDSCVDMHELLERYHELIKNPSVDESVREAFKACDEEQDLEYLLEEIPKAIDQSIDGVVRISGIVKAMKEFSHPGSGDVQAVNINHAINNTLEVARNEWKYFAEVSLDLDESLPMVSCRAGEINQVLLNLVVNASHAIKEKFSVEGTGSLKGEIHISTKADDEWLQIEIADNGTGIPEEIRERVFDPFFTTKGIGLGTGQGLAIVYDVIRNKHSGEVYYESEAGKGTRFVIRLPLVQQ